MGQCGGKWPIVTNHVIVCGVGMSLQEWLESRSWELQTKKKKKIKEKEQATSTSSDPVVPEKIGQEREKQETRGHSAGRVSGEANPEVGEEVEDEVPLAQKKKRLTKVREMGR